jgi:ribosome-associated protein
VDEEEELWEQPEQPSKSEIKRELAGLQRLAERLLSVGPTQWQRMGFGPKMMEALEESARVKGNNAMRRHIRRLGKLLRDEDSERVSALFADIDNLQRAENDRFHRLEQWRERLLQGGDAAINDLLAQCPEADRQQLRQLVRAGVRERQSERPPAAQRKLFKYLRELSLD